MALNEKQQFNELLEKSKNILICFGKKYSGDALASALALAKYLKEDNKKVDIVCADFSIGEFGFLENVDEVKSGLINLRQFVINIDLKNKKVDEFTYDVENDKLKIFVLPREGEFSEKDVGFEKLDYRYDLIVNLDTTDLESLGDIYFENSEFFFSVPIINIDSNLANENYGQLNLVDSTKTSVAEILFNILGSDLIDEDMATCLLTGLISKTKSFKTSNVTPRTLQVVSHLLNSGADKEKIISNLYRNKTLSKLKLWGRILARIRYDSNLKLVWSVLPYSDFKKVKAQEKDVEGIIDELIFNSPQAEIVLIVYEKENGEVGGQLYTKPNFDSRYLLNNMAVEGSKNFVKFSIKDKGLIVAEEEILRELKGKLIKQNR